MTAGSRGEFLSLPQEKVIYGAGSLEGLAAELDRLGGRRALVITGESLATRTPVIQTIERILGERHAGTYHGIRQHAPESGIIAASRLARQAQADVLVSVGGGSPIDAAKAVGRALAEESDRFPPHVAIPTTLSAAEFSHVAGYTDETARSKTGFSDPRATPRLVILDPEITLHTPLWLWLSSGLRALDHAVETLYAAGYHPVSDVLALEAIDRLFQYLPCCKSKPENIDARHQCQLAAWMSYFSPASVPAHRGLSHTIGKRIGARYDVPHGITSCILLAPVMGFKAETQASRLAPIAARLGLSSPEIPEREAALVAAGAVAELVRRLELPTRLREVNVPQEALPEIAHDAASEEASAEQILAILKRAW